MFIIVIIFNTLNTQVVRTTLNTQVVFKFKPDPQFLLFPKKEPPLKKQLFFKVKQSTEDESIPRRLLSVKSTHMVHIYPLVRK